MPYLWINNKVAVELEELVPAFWSSLKCLQVELNRYKEKPYGIKRLQLGGNGRKMLIDFDTLKTDIQEALGDPRKLDNPIEMFFEFDADAKRYYDRFERENGNRLTDEEKERYIINASVMKAVIQLEKARIQERIKLRGSLKGITATLVADVENFQNVLKVKYHVEAGHTLPASVRRFKEVFKACKEDLYYPLIKDPKGSGKQNARKVDERVEMIFNALFKNQDNKPTPTEVARSYDAFLSGYATLYNEDTGEIFNPSEFKPLSETTIINYINKWENRAATHKVRSGNRQEYMGKYKPHAQLEMPVLAGSLISIDDRQPPFWYEKGKRAWFYIGMDVASRCFTTVVYGKSKEGIILDFYRQMVRNYTEWGFNLPNELECESSLNSSFKTTLLQPGAMFQQVRIEANNARGKYIERQFGALRYEHEKKAYGWIARPTAKAEANQAGPGENKIIPYDQLINARMLDLEQWNNMPHPDNPEMSRWDYFVKNQNPELKPTNWEGILPHLGRKEVSSCNTGYVILQGKKRALALDGEILTGERLIQKMKMIEGKTIEVYWLDGNDGDVLKALAYIDGRVVCELMAMPRYNRATIERTPEQAKARELQSAYSATVDAFVKTQLKKIDNINITGSKPLTVNSNFRFSNLKRYEAREEPAEVFDDEPQEETAYPPVKAPVRSWRSNFIQ